MNDEIAIIGVGMRCSMANNMDEFADIIENGKVCTTSPAEERIQNSQIPTGKEYMPYGYLDRVDVFDHNFFKLSKTEADAIDPGQRILMELVCEAIENSGYSLESISKQKTGLFVSTNFGMGTYNLMYKSPNPELDFVGGIPSMSSGRIANFLNINGPVVNIDTACSSSLVAVHEAAQKIKNGALDMAIVAGVRLLYSFGELEELKNNPILDPKGICRAFDENASGTSGGEGAAVVILKRAQQSIADNDSILALIKGSAINHDGSRSNGITAPSPRAQKDVLLQACEDAKVPIASIGYIETHGTGTKLGDPIEYKAIKEAFHTAETKFQVRLGTLKPNIGHLDNLSGLLGLVKAAIVLHRKQFFPMANFTKTNAFIDEDPNIILRKEGEEWQNPLHEIRRAGVSAFGLSGTNAHIVLEEHKGDALHKGVKKTSDSANWIKLSAKNKESMRRYVEQLETFLVSAKDFEFDDTCVTLNKGRSDYDYGIAFAASNNAEMSKRISESKAVISKIQPMDKSNKVACLLLSDSLEEDLAVFMEDAGFSRKYDAFKNSQDNSQLDSKTVAIQCAFYHYLNGKGFSLDYLISNGTTAKKSKLRIEGKEEIEPSASGDLNHKKFDWEKFSTLKKQLAKEKVTLLVIGKNTEILANLEKESSQCNLVCIDVMSHLNNGWSHFWTALYNAGLVYDWDKFYNGQVYKKILAPSYPFDEISCWNPIKNPLLFGKIQEGSEKDAHNGNVLKGLSEEKVVLEILTETLGNSEIKLTDDFFELGGNSIVGIKFINRINELYKIELEFDQLYDCLEINDIIQLIRESHTSENTVEIEEKHFNTGFPLTHAQEKIWQNSQKPEKTALYNLNANFQVFGTINKEKFERAVNFLIEKHDNFRMSFKKNEEGQLEQQIITKEKVNFKLGVLDHTKMKGKDTVAIINTIYNQAFDLEKDIFIRVKLIKRAKKRYILVLSFHHIVFDWWSSAIFIRQLLNTYNELIEFDNFPKIQEGSQFSTYLKWYANAIDPNKLIKAQKYWSNTLKNQKFQLYVEANKEQIESIEGEKHFYHFPDEVVKKLRGIADQNRTTLFVALVTTLRSYFYRISEKNITIGTQFTGRLKEEFENTLGLFLNTLPLVTDLQGQMNFIDSIVKEKQTVAGALQNQIYPYDALLKDLQSKEDIFDVMIKLQRIEAIGPDRSDRIADTPLSFEIGMGYPMKRELTKHNLSFNFYDTNDSLRLELIYKKRVFDENQAMDLIHNYATFLGNIVENNLSPIDEIPYQYTRKTGFKKVMAAIKQRFV